MTWDINTLKLVNTKVNMLPYVAQVGDDWNPKTSNGFDCNNYATVKAEELAARGVPVSAMRLATCYVKPGRLPDDYHAVLLVDYRGQTYVLCNRYPYPMEIQLLPYEFVYAQNAALEWEKVAA